MLFHAGLWFPGGFVGVDVFFVISGFVIARLLVGELGATGRLDLWRFYGRRVKRLLPALAVVVAAVVVAGVLLNPFGIQGVTARTGVAASLFGANGYLYAAVGDSYFNLQTELDPLLHTWTLAVEEQFYLVFPAVLLLAWRYRGRRGAAWSLAAVGALSFVLSLAFSYDRVPVGWPRPEMFAFYSSPTRAWEFALGALVALAEPRLRRLPRHASVVVGGVGLLLVVGSAVATPDQRHFPGLFAVLPVAGTAAIIAGGSRGSTIATRLLEWRPATWIGDRSYSWYLWHWPFIVDARAVWPGVGWAPPLAAAVSLLPTYLSYRYVENPVRRSPRIVGRRIAYVGVACSAAAVGACAVLVAAHTALARTSRVRATERALRLHADFTHGCMNTLVPLRERLHDACAWRPVQSSGLIVLVGDSNAGHLAEPTIAAGNRLGYTVVAYTASACPFVLVRVYDSFADPGFCERLNEQRLDDLLRAKPALVVLANRSDGYIRDGKVALAEPSGGARQSSPEAKRVLWTRGLRRVLDRVNGAGIRVLLVHPTPRQPGVHLRSCAVVTLFVARCEHGVTRRQADAEERVALRAENAAAAGAALTSAYSPAGALCDATSCAVRRGGLDLYFDADHLSVAGAETLTGDLEGAIRGALVAGPAPSSPSTLSPTIR